MHILLLFREVPRNFQMHKFAWHRNGGDDRAGNVMAGATGARTMMWLALAVSVALILYSLYRLGFFGFVRRLASRLRRMCKSPFSGGP
jgi:hypothetical protein